MTWVAVAIGGSALLGTGASLYENKKANKQSKGLIDQQNQRQQQLDQFGKPLLQQGQGNLDLVQNYLRQIASGDRTQTMQAMAPEINAMTQGQQGAVSAQRSMFPRGGQSASAAANLPYQLQGNINNMMMGARPQAIQQLGQLGTNQSSLGLSAMGQGAGLTNSMLQYGLDARQLAMQQGSMLGQGIGGLGQLMLQYYNSRPAGGGGGSQSPYTLPNQNTYSSYGNMTPAPGPYDGLNNFYGKNNPGFGGGSSYAGEGNN